MLRTIIATATIFSAIAAIAPAAAQTGDAPVARVSYVDLNLTSASGAVELDRRIHGAVNRICGSADPRDLAAFQQVRACRQIAFASTRSQVALATGSVQVASR